MFRSTAMSELEAPGWGYRRGSDLEGWRCRSSGSSRTWFRALLRDQHPDLAELELRDVNGGWDNQQWRLGDDLAVRLPRTERAPALLRAEQQWLPILASRLPLPTRTPVRIGTPSSRFEHTWTVGLGP